MKKTISAVLVITLLLSVLAFGSVTVGAAGNLCTEFDRLLAYTQEFRDGDSVKPVSEFDLEDIAFWVMRQYDIVSDDRLVGDWDSEKKEFTENESGYYPAFPADTFESIAHRLFDFDGTIREMIEREEEYPALEYDEKNNLFVSVVGGKGGLLNMLQGYTENTDGTYAVYIRMGELSEDQQEIWDDSYIKLTVKMDERLLKVLDAIFVDALPTEGFIAPGDAVPEIKYVLDDGIDMDREGTSAFPADTVVTAKKLENGEMFDTAKKALKDILDGDKMAAFDFTATANDAAVQPNGKVKVTFAIPSHLSTENLKLFYISESGEKEEISLSVDKENRTAAAELEHFSVYVLCNTTAPLSPETGDDGTVFVAMGIAVLALAAIGVCFAKSRKRECEN